MIAALPAIVMGAQAQRNALAGLGGGYPMPPSEPNPPPRVVALIILAALAITVTGAGLITAIGYLLGLA